MGGEMVFSATSRHRPGPADSVKEKKIARALMNRTLAKLAMLFAFALITTDAIGGDAVPRPGVMAAYEPEWVVLEKTIQHRKEYTMNGTRFLTGEIEGKPVLLFLSGVSMVNAAMTTQFALDHFNINRIVFSGIAGGADPTLSIGDVVVPRQWSQYLEMIFANKKKGDYTLPEYAKNRKRIENFGMMFPQPVTVTQKGHVGMEERFWFLADSNLLAAANKVAHSSIKFKKCTTGGYCVTQQPKMIVGGNGVSGQVFADNKKFREYTFRVFKAEVQDMETAAVAHVAYTNNIPFIAFRSVSDLAGGGASQNEEETYCQLASDNAAMAVVSFLKILPN
jgi:adenosylhomocysteine nucleosidase